MQPLLLDRRYRLISPALDRGGMGDIYRAQDEEQKRIVAVKMLNEAGRSDPERRQRFLNEIRITRQLGHPNIIPVLDYKDHDQPYMVMKYITGGSLRQKLGSAAAQLRLDPHEAARIIKQIADALAYVHRSGFVHRDVKPENVLLDIEKPPPQAVLIDFGLAQVIGQPSVGGAPKGTYYYMSPEQIRNPISVDQRADIYALGVMLYELVCGAPPFRPASLAEAGQMHQAGSFPKPSELAPGLPPQLEAIILRALQREPANRFTSAGELATALARVYPDLGPSVPGAAPRPPSRPAPSPSAPANGPRASIPSPIPSPIAPAQPHPGQSTHYDRAGMDDKPGTMESLPASAADAGRARLVFAHKDQPLSSPTASMWLEKPVIYIGREVANNEPGASLALPNEKVSRQHARLDRLQDGRYQLLDLGSTNGTYLGGERLRPNVPQEWTPGKIARIGDFWVKLEVVKAPPVRHPARQTRKGLLPSPGGGFVENEGGAAPVEAVPASAAKLVQAVESARLPSLAPVGPRLIDQIPKELQISPAAPAFEDQSGSTIRLLSVQDEATELDAGGRGTITVKFQNMTESILKFSVALTGLPPGWTTVPSEALTLEAQSTQAFAIALELPRSPKALAGTHDFDLRIQRANEPQVFVRRRLKLIVRPYYDFKTDLQLKRVRGSSAPLDIINNGNAAETYTIAVDDPEQLLNAKARTSEITVQPGSSENVILEIMAARPRLVGLNRNVPFNVTVRSQRPDGGKKTEAGEFIWQALLPAWAAPLLMTLLLACVGLAAVSVISINNGRSADATATVQAVTQAVVAGATLTAESDVDGDGLSYADEIKLGTDPEVADTDRDGLTDGEEVNSYNTNPLNKDSDGDGVLDGQEILNGTNPLNRDTDGDGLPDGSDPFPLATQPPTADAAQTNAAAGPTNEAATQAAAATEQISGGATSAAQTASAPQPLLVIDPNAGLTFNDLVDGRPSPGKTITLRNRGAAPLKITALTPGGAGVDHFVFLLPPTPVDLPPDNVTSITITVRMNAAEPGSKQASLQIVTNDPNGTYTIPVTGLGSVPELTVEPSSINFGQLAAGNTCCCKVVMSNAGTGRLEITTQVNDLSAHTVITLYPLGEVLSIPAGEEAELGVVYTVNLPSGTPPNPDTRTAELAYTANFPGIEGTIAFTGVAGGAATCAQPNPCSNIVESNEASKIANMPVCTP